MFSSRTTRYPLRLRLGWLLALCAGATALFGVLAVVATAAWFQPERARGEAQELTRTLAFALEAPLAFEDAKAVSDTLAVLRARSDVRSASVYDPQGRLVSRYAAPGEPGEAAPRTGWLPDELRAEEGIRTGTHLLGKLVLEKSLHGVYQTMALQLVAVLLGSAAGLALSLAVARRVARRITDPIDELANTSSAIADGKDYSQRLRGAGDDEIGHAVSAFNNMLDELQRRGEALDLSLQTLEQRVADRTQELQRERDRAEAASLAKTRFLANMSHELRTPLNAVIGAAQLLQSSDAEVEQAHLVEVVRSSGINLLGLIENVLDISRIESGALELSCEDFNLMDCLEAALATASVAARAKGLAIAGIIEPSLPVWRYGDVMRLRQVVLNLLGNAVKFTPVGEVVMRVTAGALPDAIHVSVRDNGIGIDLSTSRDIFEPFRQADETTTRRFGGTGLGLAISRQVVRAMGGDITVASQLGAGSEFSFEVVLPPPKSLVETPAPLRHRVLYFEPHAASAEAIAALLARCGCAAVRIGDPTGLRAWFQQHNDDAMVAERPWLLIATDSRRSTPILQEASRWIDSDRVIEMTRSEALLADPAHAGFKLARGIIKPLLRPALVSRIGSLPRVRAPVVRQRPDDENGAGLLLVVEDDAMNQMIVRSMLEAADYRVMTADDGRQALAMLRECDFDLVLMDWQMPDMDGLAVTRLMRAGAVGAYGQLVPIVALTANAFAEDRAACLAAGMNDFLTKPVLAAQLLAVVRRWILQPEGSRFGLLTQPALL